MTIFILEVASTRLRGELTKWLLELAPGVYAGKISALVREKLWDKVCCDVDKKGALCLFSYANEQTFHMLMTGNLTRKIVDFDGIQLIAFSKTNGNSYEYECTVEEKYNVSDTEEEINSLVESNDNEIENDKW